MDYAQIKASLAPCGLSCEKCFAYVDGDIRRQSLNLKEKLGNFGPYAKRYETLLRNPVFGKYPDFVEMLDYFASEKFSTLQFSKIFTLSGSLDEFLIGNLQDISCWMFIGVGYTFC